MKQKKSLWKMHLADHTAKLPPAPSSDDHSPISISSSIQCHCRGRLHEKKRILYKKSGFSLNVYQHLNLTLSELFCCGWSCAGRSVRGRRLFIPYRMSPLHKTGYTRKKKECTPITSSFFLISMWSLRQWLSSISRTIPLPQQQQRPRQANM